MKYSPLERYTALDCLLHPYYDELRISTDPQIQQYVKNLDLLKFDQDIEQSHFPSDRIDDIRKKLSIE